jgi:carboxylesterase
MRLVGDYLHKRGYTVFAPLLHGHGTSVEELNESKWTDWVDCAADALAELRARCERVFVGGLSMGSLLAIYLAGHNALPGAILYSPAVKVANRLIHLAPILKYLVPKKPKSKKSDLTDPEAEQRKWSYDAFPSFAAHELLKLMRHAQRLLPQVTCPLLIVHSTGDETIQADAAEFVCKRAGSTHKKLVTLHNSGHILTVDSEWRRVAGETHRFIQTYLPRKE